MALNDDERQKVAARADEYAARFALFSAHLRAGDDLSVAAVTLGPLQKRKLADELVALTLSEAVDNP